MNATPHKMPIVGGKRRHDKCAHCTSRYGIEQFVARVRDDLQFAAALDEVMASGQTRRVGEFLCENSYKASAREFAFAMESELDNPSLPHLTQILARWGHRARPRVEAP